MIRSITPPDLASLHGSVPRLHLIDVRTPDEFRELHVAYARNVPLESLDERSMDALGAATAGEPVFVICRSASHGRQACQMLAAAGIADVVNIDGGTLACQAAGLPMAQGDGDSLSERPIRGMAGGCLLLSHALGGIVFPT